MNRMVCSRKLFASIAAAALCLVATAVSCGGKEQEASAPEVKTVTETSTPKSDEDGRKPHAPRQETEAAPVMQVEIEVPLVAVPPPPPPPRPRTQTANKPIPAAPEAQEPPPPPEPVPPPPEPEPQPPRITVESISGTKVVNIGQPLALTGNTYTEGDGKPDGFSWTFKNGGDVIERKTETSRVEVSLDKPGEWVVTCGVLWRGKVISSMNIRVNAVAPADPM